MIELQDNKVYTVEELGKMLKASPKTIRALIQRGELKSVKVGKKRYIHSSSVNEYLRK